VAAENDPLAATRDGVLLSVRVQPRAAKPGVAGVRNGALVVRLKSAPEKGRANAELIELLAEFFDTPKSGIGIKSGASGRNKKTLLRDISMERARKSMEAATGE
jgi:hypothetical protein